MRALAVAFVLASPLAVVACELQPPPKQQPASATTTAPVDAAGVPTPSPRVGTPVGSEECLKVGEHFAKVLVDTSTDPAERAILEQERTRNVRRQGETCETNHWDQATRDCFLRATTREALQACIPPTAMGSAGSAHADRGSALEPPPLPTEGSAARGSARPR